MVSLGEQGEGAPTQRTIRRLSIILAGRRHEWSAGQDLGRTVLRRDFDRFLAEGARRAGSALHQQVRLLELRQEGGMVKARTTQGDMSAKFLILAEGTASGNASRVLGDYPEGGTLNGASLLCLGDLGLSDSATFILPARRKEMASFIASGARICAAFPVKEGTILSTISRASSAGLDGALRQVAGLYGLEPVGRACAHPIPVAIRERLVSGRCLAVGDCAGLASPFSGEGLTPAIESANLAAEAVISSVREGRHSLGLYEKAMRAKAERDQTLARVTGGAVHLAVRGGWAGPLLAGLERDPAFIEAFVAVATREEGSRRFLLRVLPRLPAALASGSGAR